MLVTGTTVLRGEHRESRITARGYGDAGMRSGCSAGETAEAPNPRSVAGWNTPAGHRRGARAETPRRSALTGNQILKACGSGVEPGEIRPKMLDALEGTEPLMLQRKTALEAGCGWYRLWVSSEGEPSPWEDGSFISKPQARDRKTARVSAERRKIEAGSCNQ
jgi:hypothetical protein